MAQEAGPRASLRLAKQILVEYRHDLRRGQPSADRGHVHGFEIQLVKYRARELFGRDLVAEWLIVSSFAQFARYVHNPCGHHLQL